MAIAANGSMVYVSGGSGGIPRVVMSVDRQGRGSAVPGLEPDTYRDVRVSPDGRTLALATETDVWTYDIARATRSKLTTDEAQNRSPLWTPDGKHLIFTSRRAGYPELFSRPADGTGVDERFLTVSSDLLNLRADSWSPDGAQLLVTETQTDARALIRLMSNGPGSDVKVLLKGEFRVDSAAVSPNGRWIAYQSTRSGRLEVYVERYPGLGDRH